MFRDLFASFNVCPYVYEVSVVFPRSFFVVVVRRSFFVSDYLICECNVVNRLTDFQHARNNFDEKL